MSLHKVFNPKTIAVIGASHQEGSVGNDVVKNLTQSFAGTVIPINPKGGMLYGLEVTSDISDVKTQVDLAVIAVPAAIVPTVLTAVGKKKIRAAIVLSAGFSEVGEIELEKKIVSIAEKYKITLIGPNCLGMLNPHLQLNASFAPTMPPAGSIAFLSQSGALGVAVLDYAKEHNLGFSKFLSMGNKASVTEAELLTYLAKDPATKVILLYVEEFAEFASIIKVAHKIRAQKHPKPIIVLKSGQTDQGAAAAQSHTGALAGSDELYNALFRQTGIIRAKSVEELFLFAECFMYNPVLKSDAVAVLTNAGGLGVLVTDALVQEGMQLATLSDSTQQKLATQLPAAASTHNPVDILGDAPAQRYADVLSVLVEDASVGAIAILLTPQSMTEVRATAEVIVAAKQQTKKPIITTFLGGARVQQGLDILHNGQVTTTEFPEALAQDFSVLHAFSTWKRKLERPQYFRDVDKDLIQKIIHKNKGRWLKAPDALKLLDATQLPIADWVYIQKKSDLKKVAAACGDKVVLKVCSSNILHKSDAGAVLLHVDASDTEKLEQSYEKLLAHFATRNPKAQIDGVLAMRQLADTALEIIVGAVRDPHLGSLIGCGLGGVFTENFQDAAFGLAPVTKSDISEVINRLRIAPIIAGARGQKKYDRAALEALIARLSWLSTTYPEIAEIDCNPVFLFTGRKGASIVDARIRIF